MILSFSSFARVLYRRVLAKEDCVFRSTGDSQDLLILSIVSLLAAK